MKNRVVTAYYGGPVPIRKFSPEHGTQGLMWFSENRDDILRGADAQSVRYLMTVQLKVKNVAGWREYHDRLGHLFSKRYGFDSVRLGRIMGGADWALRDPRRVKVIAIEERPPGGWERAGRAEGRMAACRFFFSEGFDRELRRRITSERFDRETLACQTEARRWAKKIARWTGDVVELHGGFFYEGGEATRAVGHAWIEVDGEIFDPTAEQFDAEIEESFYDTHEIVEVEP